MKKHDLLNLDWDEDGLLSPDSYHSYLVDNTEINPYSHLGEKPRQLVDEFYRRLAGIEEISELNLIDGGFLPYPFYLALKIEIDKLVGEITFLNLRLKSVDDADKPLILEKIKRVIALFWFKNSHNFRRLAVVVANPGLATTVVNDLESANVAQFTAITDITAGIVDRLVRIRSIKENLLKLEEKLINFLAGYLQQQAFNVSVQAPKDMRRRPTIVLTNQIGKNAKDAIGALEKQCKSLGIAVSVDLEVIDDGHTRLKVSVDQTAGALEYMERELAQERLTEENSGGSREASYVDRLT